MKLKSFAFMLILFSSISAFADDYTLPDVAPEHIGTYVPVQMEIQLKRTKLFYEALRTGYPDHHDVLFLGKNKCYSDAHFHDGYAITAKDFRNYRFVENDNGQFLIDQDGNGYRYISNRIGEDGYSDYSEYVIDILFDFMKDMKNFSRSGSKVVIEGEPFFIELDNTFFDGKDVAIWLHSEKYGLCALMKDGINARIVKSERGEYRFWYPKEDEMIKEIPLFFVDRNRYEWTSTSRLSKNQLIYLKNYFYARHGYKFDDTDVRKYFNNFVWYKVNPNFSEKDFTNLQRNILREIQQRLESAE